MVRTFLSVWDTPPGREQMRGLLRSATVEDRAARMLREFVIGALLLPVARGLGGDHPDLRAGLVATQIVGLALLRYVIEIPPLVEADHDTIESALAPTVQRYLTGELSAGSLRG